MIKILPFLMIGKALKPLAKIKKKAWSAMGNAFGQIRKSVDPMKGFTKLLEIVNVLMLPLTYVLTLLAMVILKELLPYVGDLILILEDLKVAIEDATEATKDFIDELEDWVPILEGYGQWWENLWNGLVAWWFNNFSIPLYEAFEDLFEGILDLMEGLTGGNGDGGGGGGWFDDAVDFWDKVGSNSLNIGGSSSSSSTTNLTIDLSGSVIDDREKLVRDVSEVVITRLG